jgi:hypothetical protein
VTGGFGKYTFFAKKRFPLGADIFRDKSFQKLLDDFVVCVSKALVPLDALHGRFVRHGGDDDIG